MDFKKYLSRDKPNLIMMIGISGCGKSTVAENICKQSGFGTMKILSSDKLREEIYHDVNDQTHNEEIFGEIRKRAFNYCKEDIDVIIDATNLSIKDRAWIFHGWKKEVQCNRIACVIPTLFEKCKEQNKNRERVVPDFVLERQIRKFEMPFYEEGWDKIVIWNVRDIDVKMNLMFHNSRGTPDYIFKQMVGFDQKNSHHQYSLDRHCFLCYKEMNNETDNNILLRACQIHDIGKIFTQQPRENNPNYSYFNHHNYGAYYLLSHWKEVGIRRWMGIQNSDDLIKCIFYVNYHMQPFFIKSEANIEKYKNLWGEELYSELMLFNKCDKIASGTERDS